MHLKLRNDDVSTRAHSWRYSGQKPAIAPNLLSRLLPYKKRSNVTDSDTLLSASLSRHERELVINYQVGSRFINNTLRETKALNALDKRAINTLDKAVHKSGAMRPLKVYRGVHAANFHLPPQLRPGVPIFDAGYLSTSRSFEIARQFAHLSIGATVDDMPQTSSALWDGHVTTGWANHVIFTIFVAPEQRILDLSWNATQWSYEQEMLLPRRTRLDIIDFTVHKHYVGLDVKVGLLGPRDR